MHIETLTVTATAAATTGTAATPIGTDSLVIKNGRGAIDIIACWQTNQTAGFGQIAFPTAHDTTRGYRAGTAIGVNPAMLAMGVRMKLTAQETIAPVIGATAVAGDVEQMSMLIRYADFPGLNARMISPSQLENQQAKLTTIENSLASTAGPSYGTPETFVADSDLLLANRDYAILGMSSRTLVHQIYALTPDAGNVRFSCPGVLRQEITSQWFVLLSRAHGEALIPVFNSGNKNQCFVGVSTDENAGTFVVTLYLALLR